MGENSGPSSSIFLTINATHPTAVMMTVTSPPELHLLICILLLGVVETSQAFLATNDESRCSFPDVRRIRCCHTRFALNSSNNGFGKAMASSKRVKSKKKKASSRPSLPRYKLDTSKSTQDLLEWLEEEEIEGLEGVEVGLLTLPSQKTLRGVFATRNFAAGEYILAVPFVSTLLVHEDFQKNDTGTGDGDGTIVTEDLTLSSKPENGLLLWQKFLQPTDFAGQQRSKKFAPYLDCLPMTTDDPNFDETPDFWTNEEIRRLQVPSIVQDLLARKTDIQRLVDIQNSRHPDNSAFLEDIKQACWLMQTRGFTTFKKAMDLDGNGGLLSRVVLVPFVDLVNHGTHPENAIDMTSVSNADLAVVETKAYEESFYALVASQPIRKGQEIRICYGTGQDSSADLYVRYGFLPMDNQSIDEIKVPALIQSTDWGSPNDNGRQVEGTGSMDTLKGRDFIGFLLRFCK